MSTLSHPRSRMLLTAAMSVLPWMILWWRSNLESPPTADWYCWATIRLPGQATFIIICMSWEHNITYSDHTKWKSFGTYRGNWWSLVMTSCCHPERWGMLFAYMWIHCSSLECHTPDLNLSEGLWGHAWSLLLDPRCSGCYDKKLAFIGLWPLFQHSWKVLM